MIPLTELTEMLLHPATPYEARDRAVRAVLRRAQREGGDWTVGLAGVLLPRLRAAIAPMARTYPFEAADLEAEALAALVEVVGVFDKRLGGVVERHRDTQLGGRRDTRPTTGACSRTPGCRSELRHPLRRPKK